MTNQELRQASDWIENLSTGDRVKVISYFIGLFKALAGFALANMSEAGQVRIPKFSVFRIVLFVRMGLILLALLQDVFGISEGKAGTKAIQRLKKWT